MKPKKILVAKQQQQHFHSTSFQKKKKRFNNLRSNAAFEFISTYIFFYKSIEQVLTKHTIKIDSQQILLILLPFYRICVKVLLDSELIQFVFSHKWLMVLSQLFFVLYKIFFLCVARNKGKKRNKLYVWIIYFRYFWSLLTLFWLFKILFSIPVASSYFESAKLPSNQFTLEDVT